MNHSPTKAHPSGERNDSFNSFICYEITVGIESSVKNHGHDKDIPAVVDMRIDH